MPKTRGPGDPVFAGSINTEAALRVTVTKAAEDNTISRIIRMVEDAQSSRPPIQGLADRVVADFERLYFAEVMRVSNFDMKTAEQHTGLSMQSLYRLLKKNGLRLKDLKNAEGLDK